MAAQQPINWSYLTIMHAKFQASIFTGVGGEWGDGCMPDPHTKFLNSPFAPGGITTYLHFS